MDERLLVPPRERWANAWRLVRTLRRGGDDAVGAAIELRHADRLISGCALIIARSLRTPPPVRGLYASCAGLDLASVLDLTRVRYARLPLSDLDHPRCRVCRARCSPGGCAPDLCSDVTRPAWPRGGSTCEL